MRKRSRMAISFCGLAQTTRGCDVQKRCTNSRLAFSSRMATAVTKTREKNTCRGHLVFVRNHAKRATVRKSPPFSRFTGATHESSPPQCVSRPSWPAGSVLWWEYPPHPLEPPSFGLHASLGSPLLGHPWRARGARAAVHGGHICLCSLERLFLAAAEKSASCWPIHGPIGQASCLATVRVQYDQQKINREMTGKERLDGDQ